MFFFLPFFLDDVPMIFHGIYFLILRIFPCFKSHRCSVLPKAPRWPRASARTWAGSIHRLKKGARNLRFWFFTVCVFLINGILWDYWICLDDDFIVMSFVGNRWIGFTHGNVHLPRKPHWRKGKTMEIDYGNCFFTIRMNWGDMSGGLQDQKAVIFCWLMVKPLGTNTKIKVTLTLYIPTIFQL